MGAKSSKQSLSEVRSRAQKRTSSIQITGRYHRLPHTIDRDYAVSQVVLGTGIGGPVYVATNRRSTSKSSPGGDAKAAIRANKRYAVKPFKLYGLSKELRAVLETEVEIFLQMDHPHVCTLYDVYEGENSLQLVMECLEGGELHERVHECRMFSERQAADAAYQMLLAINYLHNRGIVHRDLKLENFLYDAKGSDHLKLIDFGLGRIWDPNRKMKAQLGTLAYLAPEVFLKSYTNKCDLWSLGVIVWVLLVGYLPFELYADQERTVLDILNRDVKVDKAKWRRVSASATDFVYKLLEVNPNKRLSASEALRHPWIETRKTSASSSVDQGVVDSLCQFASASRFRRACMQVMAWSLTKEERAQVEHAFIEMDRSKTGSIRLHELKHILEENFHIDSEEARKIFEALDSTNKEEVFYSEFLAAMMCSRIQIHEDLVLQAFRRLDKDNSGAVSVADLRSVLGDCFDGQEIDRLVEDAQLMTNGTIEFSAFMEYLCGGEAKQTHQEAAGRIIEAGLAQTTSLRMPSLTSADSPADDWRYRVPMSPKATRILSGGTSSEGSVGLPPLEPVPPRRLNPEASTSKTPTVKSVTASMPAWAYARGQPPAHALLAAKSQARSRSCVVS
mmetsp:Transcript_73771/g.171087  ORF Transcript_73771/g.171087 Transcript_73771/m.171087 type:complete len:619 (-) Transcript_73771:108-1964(-)